MDRASFGFRRLSRRRLPLDDDAVDRLSEREREAVAAMWSNRAAAELKVASAFTALASDLFAIGTPPEVLAIVSRAPGDEVRHAEICRRVAARYRGSEVAWPEPPPPTAVCDEPADVRCATHVVALCCLNETIAGAYLQACVDASEASLARAVFGELLSDEIDHARLGWAYLASPAMSDPVREQIRHRFPALRDATRQLWATQNPSLLPDGLPSHGLLSRRTVTAIAEEAIDSIVVSGLASVGIPVR
jgi:hypothetical protein